MIESKDQSTENVYIKKLLLNGKPLKRRYLTYQEIVNGGKIVFFHGFEDGIGTNPEELIAAAHAGCFSMALSGQLGAAGLTAESINTTAAVRLEKVDDGFAIRQFIST